MLILSLEKVFFMMDIEGRESKREGNERVGERGMERERGLSITSSHLIYVPPRPLARDGLHSTLLIYSLLIACQIKLRSPI